MVEQERAHGHLGNSLDSGVFEHDSLGSHSIERLAALAYTMGQTSPLECSDVGLLLEACLGGGRLRFVRFGVLRGDAKLTFQPGDETREGICIDCCVRSDQSQQMMTMAGAMACVRWVAWQLGQVWEPTILHAVALAIAMPEQRFASDLQVLDVPQLAAHYKVLPEHVLMRTRMIAGVHDSTERAAITSS